MDNKQLYRQESLEHISSPESLHDYMRVTSPRLWMILSAIVVLLAGFIIYASTARMENLMPIRVTVTTLTYDSEERSIVSADLPMAQKDVLDTGMEIRLGSERGKVDLISMVTEDSGTGGLYVLFAMEHNKLPLQDGEYDANLVLESTTPISFLWN